jgi:hypothetical protein
VCDDGQSLFQALIRDTHPFPRSLRRAFPADALDLEQVPRAAIRITKTDRATSSSEPNIQSMYTAIVDQIEPQRTLGDGRSVEGDKGDTPY